MELAIIEACAFGWLGLGYVLGVIVHEAGHAVVAWAFRFQLRQVCVGTGRVLLRLRRDQTWFVLRAVPVAGYILNVPPPPHWRARRAMVTAAGAAANGVMLLLASVLYRWRPAMFGVEHPAAYMSLVSFAVAQIMIIVFVLAPRHGTIAGARVVTDGLRLWHLVTRPAEGTLPWYYALVMRDVLAPGVKTPALSAFSAEIVHQSVRLDRRRDAWAAREAADTMQAMLRDATLPVLERAVVLHFLVANALLFGNTGADLASLDTWSQQALALAPTPTQRVFRGGVLVALGRFDEAERCLRDAVDEAKEGEGLPKTVSVFLRVFWAQIGAGRGSDIAAKTWIKNARAAVPKHMKSTLLPIVARLEAGLRIAHPPLEPVSPSAEATTG